MKKIVSVVIALILFAFAAVPLPSRAYQITTYRMASDDLSLTVNTAGAFLMNVSGNEAHIEKLAPDTYGADLRTDRTIADFGVFGNTVVLLCNDVPNNQLLVYTYRAETDVLDSFAINDKRHYAGRGFCYAGNCVYLLSDVSKTAVDCYSSAGKLLNSYSFSNEIDLLCADHRGGVCAVSNGTLYIMSGDRFVSYSGVKVKTPIAWLDDTHLCDASGQIIEVSGGVSRTMFKADTDYGRHCACMIDDTVYYPNSTWIYGYDAATGKKRSRIDLDSAVSDLFSYGGMIYALSVEGTPTVSRIRADEFTDITTRSAEPALEPINGGSFDGAITSDVYRVDHNSYRISGIPAGTTLAGFKQNMSFDGYTVSFYRDGSQKSSGSCGTAMTAVFENDRRRCIYELSVVGDLTGEGNVNTRDLSLLMEYLTGTADFNGVYLLSADLSDDGAVDVKDLALMHRML